MGQKIAIYPGSFDPPTYGHLDLIQRGSRLFDQLIVSILTHPDKNTFFTVSERVMMLKELTGEIPNVLVETFTGLLVTYAKQKKATAVLRGIRAFSDFEYELQMALMNRKLDPSVETIFLMPSASCLYISSHLVKEIAQYGGSVRNLVPTEVEKKLQDKINFSTGENL